MQEEYQKRLEQEVQQYISYNSNRQGTDSLPVVREAEDKMISRKKAIETAKQILHQTRGESRLPEMDWDYYGTHVHAWEQP